MCPLPSALCPGEHPQLCECAIVCVAAHRGGHGQPPLPLSVLGLMLGHVPRRTLTRTLTLTLALAQAGACGQSPLLRHSRWIAAGVVP